MVVVASSTVSAAKTMQPLAIHLCSTVAAFMGSQRSRPSLRPTAMRIVSSSKHNPRDGTGSALSHAPDSGLDVDIKRAWERLSDAFSRRDSMQMAILCASHTLCWWDSGAGGGVFSCPSCQSAMKINK